ncbi:MAG: dihydropteroate synthase [Planctomycetota bacterium]
MGVLNVTPDSFSDGGDHYAPAEAVAHAQAMIADGADIIDIGPESTRPGAREVAAAEQIRRAVPVIEAIRAQNDTIAISIDTRLAPVAQAALDAGADVINDISALRDDPAMSELAATTGAPVVLMHRRGTSVAMQKGGGPQYDDVIGEICTFLKERVQHAVSCGIDPRRIIIDPGLGFGKRVEHNLLILRHVDRFVALRQPVLIGASRKSFIGSVLRGGTSDTVPHPSPQAKGAVVPHSSPQAKGGERGQSATVSPPPLLRKDAAHPTPGIDHPKHRESASLACAAIAVMAGASIIRAHDVRPTVQVIRLCTAIRGATQP